jgi:hypothetical protein
VEELYLPAGEAAHRNNHREMSPKLDKSGRYLPKIEVGDLCCRVQVDEPFFSLAKWTRKERR